MQNHNKYFAVFAVIICIIIFAGGVYFFTKHLQTPSSVVSTESNVQIPSVLPPSTPGPESESDCADLTKRAGLPSGSYELNGTFCEPTAIYRNYVTLLAKDDTKGSDATESVLITNVYKKSGSIYIDTVPNLRRPSPEECDVAIDAPYAPKDSNGKVIPGVMMACDSNSGWYELQGNLPIKTYQASSDVKIRLFADVSNGYFNSDTLTPDRFFQAKSEYYLSESPYLFPFTFFLKEGKLIAIHAQWEQ